MKSDSGENGYHEGELDWRLLQHASHGGIQTWVRDLNHLYRNELALHELDFSPAGFEWIDLHDWEQSAISFARKGRHSQDAVLVVCNFTPVPRLAYRVGVPTEGFWKELLNSDAECYGGSGYGNFGGLESIDQPRHGCADSLWLTLPPLGILFLKPMTEGQTGPISPQEGGTAG